MQFYYFHTPGEVKKKIIIYLGLLQGLFSDVVPYHIHLDNVCDSLIKNFLAHIIIFCCSFTRATSYNTICII